MCKYMIRSALGYSGSKYTLLDQLLPLFPQEINNFYDVFAGSLSVSLNVTADSYKCNDIRKPLIDLYNYLKNEYSENVLNEYVIKYDLLNITDTTYYRIRDEYNINKDPLLLFILARCSFNHDIRFNKNNGFNTSYGKGNNFYNTITKDFLNKIQDFDFYSLNFKDFLNSFTFKENDFIYLDPPYLITKADYNCLWNEKAEIELLDFCKNTNVKWGLSNVFEHKGLSNDILKEFAKNFNAHYLYKKYNNWDNASKNKSSKTIEVYICNY